MDNDHFLILDSVTVSSGSVQFRFKKLDGFNSQEHNFIIVTQLSNPNVIICTGFGISPSYWSDNGQYITMSFSSGFANLLDLQNADSLLGYNIVDVNHVANYPNPFFHRFLFPIIQGS